jgi:hypothetical protein
VAKSVHYQNEMIFFQNIHIFQFYFFIWTVIFKFLEVLPNYPLFFFTIDIVLFLNILKFLTQIDRKGYLLIVIYQLFCLTWYTHHLFHLFHLKYRNLLTKRDSNLPIKIYLNFIFIYCNFYHLTSHHNPYLNWYHFSVRMFPVQSISIIF